MGSVLLFLLFALIAFVTGAALRASTNKHGSGKYPPRIRPKIYETVIIDPRTNPVALPSRSNGWHVEAARERNILIVSISGYDPLTHVDLLEQLLTSHPPDHLLWLAEGVLKSDRKKIIERRSDVAHHGYAFREQKPFSVESLRQLCDLLRESNSPGSTWSFCTFSEQNRAAAEQVEPDKLAPFYHVAAQHPEIFDMVFFYNIDRPEIEIDVCRPELFDDVIAVIKSYTFEKEPAADARR